MDPKYDLTGKRFGKLTALRLHHTTPKRTFWTCQCDCGNITVVRANALRSGKTKSCGCYQKERMHELHFIDLTGKVINGIEILEHSHKDKKGQHYWKCRCHCGNIFYTRTSAFMNDNIKSCGCINSNETHGLSKHPLYTVYADMVARCYNPKHHAYKWYGGRGIYIVPEWYTPGVPGNPGFVAFYNWAITHGYRKGLTIERENVNGPYSPENCSWIDNKAQQNNKTTNMHINDGEEVLTYAQFQEKYNLSSNFVTNRVDKGWDLSAIVYAAKHPEEHVHIPRGSQKHKYPEGVYLNGEEFMILIPKLPQPEETKIKRGSYKHND